MSNLNETCAGLIVVMSMISLGHAGLHTYNFDKWRCLVPRRREWFRVLLTWMLILANVGLFVWGLGWSIVKYNLGWVILPDYGAIPMPYPMFPGKYSKVNIPLTISMNIAYSLQASLNAEEGLYWFHLMRAVRQPKSARNWLNSNYFYAWIVISLFIAFVQCGVGYIRSDGNQVLALAKELTCGGVVELFVLLCASSVLLKFPAFLKDVKASGAGPDVRARLHFYHEANKVRTFFRAVFTVTLLILGIDGCTPEMRVNNTHMASDLIIMVCLGSFFIVLMVSMTLYLPRTYNTLPRSGQVMIGQAQPAHGRNAQDMQLTSGHALMSLLREGGQWDDDDDLRAGITTVNGTQSQHNLEVGGPFDSTPKNWSLSSGQLGKEDKWEEDVEAQRPELPSVLEHFTSPISVQRAEVSSGPLRIHIQREVRQDRA